MIFLSKITNHEADYGEDWGKFSVRMNPQLVLQSGWMQSSYEDLLIGKNHPGEIIDIVNHFLPAVDVIGSDVFPVKFFGIEQDAGDFFL